VQLLTFYVAPRVQETIHSYDDQPLAGPQARVPISRSTAFALFFVFRLGTITATGAAGSAAIRSTIAAANPATSKRHASFGPDSERPKELSGSDFIARSSFDPVEFVWYGVISAVGQAQNSESAYGQGWGAYGKRYATNLADGTVEGFMTSAILPSVLKQDPRYYVLGHGGFWHRTSYALSRLIITRSDSGSSQFNASEIFGSASAAAISTYGYHPENDKTLGNAASVWGTQVAYDGLAFVVKEFWPDIRRKIRSKRAGDQN
jgi:hypothetical protein